LHNMQDSDSSQLLVTPTRQVKNKSDFSLRYLLSKLAFIYQSHFEIFFPKIALFFSISKTQLWLQ
jgi:hypothetical protein